MSFYQTSTKTGHLRPSKKKKKKRRRRRRRRKRRRNFLVPQQLLDCRSDVIRQVRCVDLASRDVKLSFQPSPALSPRGEGGAEGWRMRVEVRGGEWGVGESIVLGKRDTCEGKPILSRKSCLCTSGIETLSNMYATSTRSVCSYCHGLSPPPPTPVRKHASDIDLRFIIIAIHITIIIMIIIMVVNIFTVVSFGMQYYQEQIVRIGKRLKLKSCAIKF